MIIPKGLLGDSLAVELPALNRATLVRIQVPQPIESLYECFRILEKLNNFFIGNLGKMTIKRAYCIKG